MRNEMSNYISELHKCYTRSINAFREVYPIYDNTMAMMIDNYLRTCAMYIWNYTSIPVVDCLNGVNAIYSSENVRRDFTIEQVETALRRLSNKNYSIPVPGFFMEIVERDIADDTNISRKLVSCFNLIMISFGMINGELSDGEMKIIANIRDSLNMACNSKNVKEYTNSVFMSDYTNNNHDLDVKKTIDELVFGRSNKRSIEEVKSADELKTEKEIIESRINSESKTIDKLNGLIGLDSAKHEIKEISDFARIQQVRKERGLPTSAMSYHLVFTGNPGTGKTTVARLVAQIYKELGILSKGHLVEASAKDLVAGYTGQTAIKTSELIKTALGGILFIDEAYSILDKSGQGYGHEAIDTMLKEMEDHRDDLAIIVAGYDEPMEDFIESNPGLKSRFNRFVHFDDYSCEELMAIFDAMCKKNAYKIDSEAKESVSDYFEKLISSKDGSFANGRTVRNYFESIISKQASRVANSDDQSKEALSLITIDDVSWSVESKEPEQTLEEILTEFNGLTGLKRVKDEITELSYVIQLQQRRKEKGLTNPDLSLHLVFTGNPGTGKTTVARYIAKIYKSLGLLTKGHFIETDRSGLVAGYVGQTAIKTQEVIESAIGGVLFVDEAYTLANGGTGDYGQEAIDTLLKAMEDKRDSLVVIVAGYEREMDTFIHSNPGLESRFNRYIHFDDYDARELLIMFIALCNKNQYKLDQLAKGVLSSFFAQVNPVDIANGRGVRNLFEKVVTQQAKRIYESGDENADVSMIIDDDIIKVLSRR